MHKGFPIVRGIGIGKIVKIDDVFSDDMYTGGSAEKEVEILQYTIERASDQLRELHMRSLDRSDDSFAKVVEIMVSLMEDPEILDGFFRELSSGKNAYESIVSNVSFYEHKFSSMDSLYYKERSAVMRDIGQRLVAIILNIDLNPIEDILEASIIVAEEIKPSDVIDADTDYVKGMISTYGGETSHTAILCKAAGIPLISGVEDLSEFVDGKDIILDAIENKTIIDPDTEILEKYKIKQERLAAYEAKMVQSQPKVLKIGNEEAFVYGNISSPDDLKHFRKQKPDGIGLYRTEFLFLSREDVPTEEEQCKAYSEVVEGMKGLPVTFRTIDIGGDKRLSYMDLGHEDNPFLGYRAIRFCLEEPYVTWFRAQLRAMINCHGKGDIKIMFPMVSTISELQSATAILKEEFESLGLNWEERNIKIGIMVEVPSVAVCADQFAPYVDFFSIGTNDLTQFVLAADRMNPKLKSLYSYFNPAVLRLVKSVIEVGQKHNVEVSLCGEMASDPLAIPLLAGFGLREYSVSPPYINRTKHMLKDLKEDKLKEIVDEVMMLSNHNEVRVYLKSLQKELYGSGMFYL